MKLSELFEKKNLSLSFEVFPPKTDTAFERVKKAVEEIAELKPSFMSVTYGAGGGTSRYTLDIAKNIKAQHGVPTLAHLTCVSSTKETVRAKIEEIRAAGIENIMALRGDLTPELEASDRSKWAYSHAIDLIRDIKESSADFCIGAACYPEIHPESENQAQDIFYLKEKVDAGCSFLTTQMFFDNNLLYNFLYKIREAGITVPVIPGIMPITNANQVARSIKLSGSFMPQRFKSLVDKFGSDPAAMKQAGIAYATDQIIDLYANGISNVHVYSMNKPDIAKAIKDNVLVVTGTVGEQLAASQLADFAIWLQDSKYWREKIKYIHMKTPQMMLIYLHGDNQPHIMMGQVQEYERKLSKLRTFFEKGQNAVGEKKYYEIDVRFDGQVIGRY